MRKKIVVLGGGTGLSSLLKGKFMCLVFKSFQLFLEWRNLESQKLLDYFYSNLKGDVIKKQKRMSYLQVALEKLRWGLL